MFIVIKMFDDLQDVQMVSGIRSYHRYKPGDVYPREGYKPATARIQSLLTGDNALKTPLIAIPEPTEPEPEKVADKPVERRQKTDDRSGKAKSDKSSTEEKKSTTTPRRSRKTTAKKTTARKTAGKG